MQLRKVETSLSYGHPHLYARSPPSTILKDVTMANMTGTLAQLGLLSHHAAELFADLFKVAQDTHVRLVKCSERAAQLARDLPSAEAKAKLEEQGMERAEFAPPQPQRVVFDMVTAPAALKTRYDGLEALPDYDAIDAWIKARPKAMGEPGPCLVKYSNPNYFLNQWAADEMERITKLQAERAERKKKKRKHHHSEDKKHVKASAKGLNWKERYGIDSNEHHIPDEPSQIAPPEQPKLIAEDSPKKMEASPAKKKPPPPKHAKTTKPPPPSARPPTARPAPPSKPPPPMPAVGNGAKPPPPMPIKSLSPPLGEPTERKSSGVQDDEEDEEDAVTEPEQEEPEEDEDDPIVSKHTEEPTADYAKYYKMLKLGLPKAAVQQKMRVEGLDPSVLDEDDSDDDDDASQVMLSPRPSEFSGGTRPSSDLGSPRPSSIAAPPRPALKANFLTEIAQGKELKQVAKAPPPSDAPPKNDLLSAIKRGATLKKVDANQPKPAAPSSQSVGGLLGNEVDKILTLRSKIAADSDDDDDDSDDSDDDWDDDD